MEMPERFQHRQTREQLCRIVLDKRTRRKARKREMPTFRKRQLASHAFPGGYPIYYLGYDNAVLCPKRANKEDLLTLIGRDINYEDPDLRCDECGKRIESAYGKD